MADAITLTVTQDLASPFVLSQSSTTPFSLTGSNSGTVNIQLGASISGLVNLTGPSSIRGFEAFVAGILNPDEILLAQVAPYTFTMVEGSCSAVALVAATAESIFKIYKTVSGVTTQIGTITFAAGEETGVVAFTAPNIQKGDLITLYAPTIADATLADIAFLLVE
jgi:hypothetical protein